MRITETEYQEIVGKKIKASKYKNVKKEVNGLTFDSTKEARRYQDLLEWQHSGQIKELETQREFQIEVNGEYVCSYFADFCYIKNGERVVEDTKSRITRKLPVYVLKKKLMAAALGIEIQEV